MLEPFNFGVFLDRRFLEGLDLSPLSLVLFGKLLVGALPRFDLLLKLLDQQEQSADLGRR